VEMSAEDVVRHRLVRDIVNAYSELEEKRRAAREEAKAAEEGAPVKVNGRSRRQPAE
jgi:phosphate starvation-inducible protein PhoH and related proteins